MNLARVDGRNIPNGSLDDVNYVYAYSVSYLMEQTLIKCGDNLTHERTFDEAGGQSPEAARACPASCPASPSVHGPTDFTPRGGAAAAGAQGET